MIRLLTFLLYGCFHNWETQDTITLSNYYGSKGRRIYVKCIKCGEHKKFDLI
jgi:hypothetical protein